MFLRIYILLKNLKIIDDIESFNILQELDVVLIDVHFNFSKQQIKNFCDRNIEVTIGIDHKLYNHMSKISEETRSALAEDFI